MRLRTGYRTMQESRFFNSKRIFIKAIAAVVCLCFLWQDVAWAGGDFLRQRQIYVVDNSTPEVELVNVLLWINFGELNFAGIIIKEDVKMREYVGSSEDIRAGIVIRKEATNV